MLKIVALCNQKGGVGKTSTAVSMAACISLNGRRCLLIDLDPQGNASSGVGVDKSKVQKSIYHALLEGAPTSELIVPSCVEKLDVIPSNPDLAATEVELVGELNREGRLRKALNGLDATYDIVIIDCPPSFGLLTINALTAAHSVIIPIQCEYYALEGLSQLVKTINLIKDNLNPSLEIEGIVMTMADFRTKLTQEVIDEVRKHFGPKVYKTVIPRNIRLSEAPGFGKPIFLYDKDSEGARKYKELTKEFILNNASTLYKTSYEPQEPNNNRVAEIVEDKQ